MQASTTQHTETLLARRAASELRDAVTLKDYLFFKAACAKILNISRKSVYSRNAELTAATHAEVSGLLSWFYREGASIWPRADNEMNELRNLRILLDNKLITADHTALSHNKDKQAARSPLAIFLQAKALANQGNHLEACRRFDLIDPQLLQPAERAQMFYHWGTALGKLAKNRPNEEAEILLLEACRYFNNAIELSPHEYESFYNLGTALGKLSDSQKQCERINILLDACQQFAAAAELKKDGEEIFYNWGLALRKLAEEYDDEDKIKLLAEAGEKLETAAQLNEQQPEIFYNWANTLTKLAESHDRAKKIQLLKRACKQYQRAVKLQPDKYQAYNNWAISLRKLAEEYEGEKKTSFLRDARRKYAQVIQIKPNHHAARYNQGLTLDLLAAENNSVEKIKLLKKACQAFRSATKIKPDKDKAFYHWALALRKLAEEYSGRERLHFLEQARAKRRQACAIQRNRNNATRYQLTSIDDHDAQQTNLFHQLSKALAQIINHTSEHIRPTREAGDLPDLRRTHPTNKQLGPMISPLNP